MEAEEAERLRVLRVTEKQWDSSSSESDDWDGESDDDEGKK